MSDYFKAMKSRQEEQLLVSKVCAGDRTAFTQLIHAYERLVMHIVSPLVENKHDRADVCQDTFVKVYQQLHSFQFRSKLATWIGHIAYNTAINFLRKRRSLLLDDIFRSDIGETEENESTFVTGLITHSNPEPDAILMQKQSNQLLAQKIEQLPPLQKTVLRLFHTDDLSLEDIAAVLEMPVNTVKSHLFRARKNLKQALLNSNFLRP